MEQQPGQYEPASAAEPSPAVEPSPAPPSVVAPAPAQSITPAKPVARQRSTRVLNAILAVAVALAIAGVAFAAGRLTAPPSLTAGRFGNGNNPGQFFGNGNGNGNGGNGQGGPGGFLAGGGLTVEGTVESVSATTLTLKTASGQTIQIALDGTTTYHAQSDASASDVTTGGTVLVRVDGLRGAFGGNAGGNGATENGGAGLSASDITVVP